MSKNADIVPGVTVPYIEAEMVDVPVGIPIFCNVCLHTIRRHGSDWECAKQCRCLMIGCVPKVWS